MGVVRGSVTVPISASGNYQVTMPKANLDVIGFAPLGVSPTSVLYAAPQIVGIYIDASNIAYFVLPVTGGYTTRKWVPVRVKVKGTVLNLNIPFTPPFAGGLTIFYGDPDGSEVEFTSLKGVVFSVTNTSTTAIATGSIPVTFPSGDVKITGILPLGLNSNGVGQLSFITGTGETLYIPFSASPDPMDLPDNIYPLDLSSATTLTMNYTLGVNGSGNASVFGVIYYE